MKTHKRVHTQTRTHRRTHAHTQAHTRTHKDLWFEVAVVRASLASKIPGGISGLFHKLMTLFFNDQGGRDMLKAGVQVKLPDGECILILADIAIAIADEATLHYMYG